MFSRHTTYVTAFLKSLLLPVGLVFAGAAANGQEPAAADLAHFENHVRPLLAASCFRCHGAKKQESGLRLDSRAGLMQGGDNGPSIVPGAPAESAIIRAVRHEGDIKMPPDDKLKPEQIAALSRWIERGAPWPAEARAASTRGGSITAEERRFWSFQPIADPAPPHVQDIAWCQSAVDRFVLARLEATGQKPAPAAERRALLRRATFDLTGLPPSPEDTESFARDDSPQAFAAFVERLLASPAYGERWGRHWLDVVRYADTAGETADYPVREAYRYRNYVINAFNRDKPYDEFLREQIAGDVLAQHGPPELFAERVTATGFIAISRRFGFDPENYHHLTIQDTIDTLGQAALGLTLGCARCHDHKYDPVSMTDYYALYGIFAGTRYAFPGSEEKKRPRDFVPLMPETGAKPAEGAPSPVTSELAYAAAEGTPQNARIHKRGEPKKLGDEAPRRFLEILGGDTLPPDASGSGRLELAGWITRPENPLTARVIVNRVWQHLFGVGLVATENDFGVRGRRPTHPELLDYLARRFLEDGWSIKSLQRRILLSSVYQMSSRQVTAEEADSAMDLLGRHRPRRLDAEEIRDALLSAAGNLDRSVGGPHPFPAVDTWGFTQHNPFSAVYPTNRRSVYLLTQRLKRHSLLALFDGADPNASTPRRTETTVPTQTLFVMNDPFVHECAASFTSRLITGGTTDDERLTLAYQIAFARPASDEERVAGLAFLARYRTRLAAGGVPLDQQVSAAWSALARVLFAHSEFVYVD